MDRNIVMRDPFDISSTIECVHGHYRGLTSIRKRREAVRRLEENKVAYASCALMITQTCKDLDNGRTLYKVRLPTGDSLLIARALNAFLLFEFSKIQNSILRPVELENAAMIGDFAYLKFPPRDKKGQFTVHEMCRSLFTKFWKPIA